MHSNCKQNIYEFTKICCNVLNFSLAHKSAQLFMGVAALIEPQAALPPPPHPPDYPLFITPSLTQQLLSSVCLSACLLCCYFRYKLSAHIFAFLPIFNYTSCNMYRSPHTPLRLAFPSLRPCVCAICSPFELAPCFVPCSALSPYLPRLLLLHLSQPFTTAHLHIKLYIEYIPLYSILFLVPIRIWSHFKSHTAVNRLCRNACRDKWQLWLKSF